MSAPVSRVPAAFHRHAAAAAAANLSASGISVLSLGKGLVVVLSGLSRL